MTDAPSAEIAQMSFETALKELETIVAQLERGEVELDERGEVGERGEEEAARVRLAALGRPREAPREERGEEGHLQQEVAGLSSGRPLW